MDNKICKKIVLTGGACGGKTESLKCLTKHKRYYKSEEEYEALAEEKATLVENTLLVAEYIVAFVVVY